VKEQQRDELLGHESDGIREFNNALPRWWLYGFYFTIVFAVVYLFNYHVLATPLVGHKGSAAEYQAEMADAARWRAARPAAAGAELSPLTDAASLTKGEEIFNGPRNLCHTCHRKDLGGLIGPNLTDGQWLHGCSAGALAKDVTSGFPDRGMLPFGSGQPLTDDQVLQVVSYVISKRGSNPANPKAADPQRDQDCK
jgi:cytochrome c oxidase cbb3-type subunit 3